MALVEPQLRAFDNSDTLKNIDNIDEFEEGRSIFSINYYSDENLTDTETYSGYLYIKEFNEERFIAEFKGDVIEQCVEKRSASSIEEEQKCGAKKSQYLPETGVLNEGVCSIYIDVAIEEFLNNR